MNINNNLDSSSSLVQSHLGVLQGVISRMASNSSQCKAWCIAITSAILVMVVDREKSDLLWIATLPTVLFMFLDIYYLTLENSFRGSYNNFIIKLHDNSLSTKDLYLGTPEDSAYKFLKKSLKSFSIWGFYMGLLIFIVVVQNTIS